VALPHEVQRSLSQIREQDALHQSASSQVQHGLRDLLSQSESQDPEAISKLLDQIRMGFIDGLSHAEERVALAEHIHLSVKGHIVRLEDDLKHFEEEVRLAKISDANHTIVHDDGVAGGSLGGGLNDLDNGKQQKRRSTKSKEEIALGVSASSQEAAIAGRKRSRAASGTMETVAHMTLTASNGNSKKDSFSTSLPFPPTLEEEKQRDEPNYCYCGQPAYGEMIGCDGNAECEIEWFHYGCVGLERPPKDHWFCPDCTARMARNPMAVDVGGSRDDGSGSSNKPRPAFVK